MQSKMEETQFLEKMKEVLKFLRNPSTEVRDDTLFQKLQDTLKNRIDSPEYASTCGVIDFLKDVTKIENINVDTLSFTVQLAGNLGHKERFYQTCSQTLIDVFQFVMFEDHLQNLSVASAFFKALHTLLGSPCGQNFFSDAHFDVAHLLKISWKILSENRSIFLSRAVTDFIIAFLTSPLAAATKDSRHLNETLNTIISCVIKASKSKLGKSNNCVKCSLNAIGSVPTMFINNLGRVCDLEDALNLFLENDSDEYIILVTDCLISIHKCLEEEQAVKLKSKILSTLQSVMESDVLKSNKIARRLYNSSLSENDLMEDIFTRPLAFLFMEQKDHKRCKLDPSDFIREIIYSLSAVCELRVHNAKTCKMVVNVIELSAGLETRPSVYQRIVNGNKKIQQKCLDYLQEYFPDAVISPVLNAVSNIITSFTVEHMIYNKCLDCLLNLFPKILSSGCDLDDGKNSMKLITEAIGKNFCSMQWELRDTTVNFIGRLLKYHPDSEAVVQWIIKQGFDLFVYQALSDGESYVRATSITTLSTLFQTTSDVLQSLDVTWAEVIGKILDICTNDSEAFPRRSCVSFLSGCWKLFSNKLESKMEKEILVLMSETLTKDFDWEVKIAVIHFWHMMFESHLHLQNKHVGVPSYASDLYQSNGEMQKETIDTMNSSCLCGIEVLCKLLDDFDPSVCEAACKELVWIKSELCDKLDKGTGQGTTNENVYENKNQKLLKLISEYDLENLNQKWGQLCEDYDSNPLSLLDDILSTNKEIDESDENTIDCY